MGTWIVGLVVASTMVLAARKIYKDHKSGKRSCSDCGSCNGQNDSR